MLQEEPHFCGPPPHTPPPPTPRRCPPAHRCPPAWFECQMQRSRGRSACRAERRVHKYVKKQWSGVGYCKQQPQATMTLSTLTATAPPLSHPPASHPLNFISPPPHTHSITPPHPTPLPLLPHLERMLSSMAPPHLSGCWIQAQYSAGDLPSTASFHCTGSAATSCAGCSCCAGRGWCGVRRAGVLCQLRGLPRSRKGGRQCVGG